MGVRSSLSNTSLSEPDSPGQPATEYANRTSKETTVSGSGCVQVTSMDVEVGRRFVTVGLAGANKRKVYLRTGHNSYVARLRAWYLTGTP